MLLAELKENQRLILLIVALAVVNIMLSRLIPFDGQDLTGRVIAHNSPEMLGATVKSMLFYVQILGFALGLVAALIPYRGQTYYQKYFRASIICALGLQILICIAGTIRVVDLL
jgi:Zn-dependent protease